MAEQPDAGTQRYAQEQVNLGAEHYRQGRFAEAAAAWGGAGGLRQYPRSRHDALRHGAV